MKIKKITLVVLLGLFNVSLAYAANCGPLPGGIGWLSKAKSGNYYYYLTKADKDRPFFIVNDTSKSKWVRICVTPTINWWTTVLNKQCENFPYPSSEINIADAKGVIYGDYSAGRCDAVVSVKPGAQLTLTIAPRLRASGGNWQIENKG